MGLDVSHDAWHGAYSAFNRFRQAVAFAAGCIFPHYNLDSVAEVERLKQLDAYPPPKVAWGESEWWYAPDDVTEESAPGLYCFLKHSDCDGEISPADCLKVADELERLADKIEDTPYSSGGHVAHGGGFRKCLERFVAGCRAAAAAGEPLEFY